MRQVVAIALVALVAAGCGTATPTPSPSVTSSGPPASSSAAGASQPASVPPSAPDPGSSGSPFASAEADPGLFSIMAGDSGVGLTFQYDAQTTATVGVDPDLARIAVGLAIGLYTVQGQQPPTDFAIVSIVHLRDRTFGEEWYRQYRDSYDASACAQAGGVARNAQATLGGHTVFIGGCAGGAFTYHVRVRDGAIIVSITSAGPARLGDRLAADVDQP